MIYQVTFVHKTEHFKIIYGLNYFDHYYNVGDCSLSLTRCENRGKLKSLSQVNSLTDSLNQNEGLLILNPSVSNLLCKQFFLAFIEYVHFKVPVYL